MLIMLFIEKQLRGRWHARAILHVEITYSWLKQMPSVGGVLGDELYQKYQWRATQKRR